ncbi:MAG: hypothetical protein HDT19_08170, partial [Oscillibacter sp.]|nr:hypothetical protein [Oscillibacter sp.]
MANRTQRDDDWKSWALIVILFCLGIWPVALLILFAKLFGSDEKKAAPPPLQGQAVWQADPVANRAQGKTAKAVKKVTKSPKFKKSNAKWLKILGAVLLFAGLGGLGDAVDSMLWTIQAGSGSFWWLEDLLGACAFTAAGGGMLFKGFSMDRQMKRFSKYLSVLGEREAMPVDELARVLGYPESRVEKDLEKMIDKGYFGGRAYLNVELGYFFRSSQADLNWQEAQRKAEAAPTPKEAEEGYSGILRNIRRANDDIADPLLSAKIDRLEEITAKIFRAVEEDPKKRSKIDTFLNYYLPTTQKLLDSYATFEAAGVEGENLRQAKTRIEATMDAIVKGFEHQLDELYKADAMDVDSDIRVMETMLRRDTGSAAQDFGLDGGTAVQREE